MTPLEPTTRWTGWDVRRGAEPRPPRCGDAIDRSAGEGCFELLALAGRGFRPPRYLTALGSSDGDPRGKGGDASEEDALRIVWSIAYRRIMESAPRTADGHAIYLLGVNPPDGVTEDELETFNDFYTNVHLVEVAERRHALRAARYELADVRIAPAGGAPRFLAVYEVDEAGAAQRRHVGPPYSRGPEVWQRHTTPWRLWFRRIAQ